MYIIIYICIYIIFIYIIYIYLCSHISHSILVNCISHSNQISVIVCQIYMIAGHSCCLNVFCSWLNQHFCCLSFLDILDFDP